MIIKYIKNKEIEKSGYQFTQIVGEKADGTTYTKDFFANDADLGGQLAEFAPGEFLNLSYDTTKYKNLKSIKGADGFAAQRGGGGGGKKTSSSSNSGSGGNSRGDDYNRSAAIYLAKEVVFRRAPAKAKEPELLDSMIVAANVIFSYINEGRNSIAEEAVKGELEVADIEE